MEEIDFNQDLQEEKIKYGAVFDPDSGRVKSVGPAWALQEKTNIVEIDKEIAKEIILGNEPMSNYVVDLRHKKLEIRKKISVATIDDLVHRIIEKKWTKKDYFDIFLVYSRKKDTLTIQMTEEFRGTRKLPKKYKSIKKRDVLWEGDLDLYFYITDYNDPNILYDFVTFKINDLVGNTVCFSKLKVPDKFSVYTKRIFENYVIEIK